MSHRTRPRRARATATHAALASALAALLAACETPPLGEEADRTLRESIFDATRREMADAKRFPEAKPTQRANSSESLGISPDLMPELRDAAGPQAKEPAVLDLGEDLLGQTARIRRVSLEHAMRSAAENNLQVQFSRLAPAVSEAQLVAAEAAFDTTFFSNLTYANTNEPQIQTAQVGFSFPLPSKEQQQVLWNAGLRQPLASGGQITIQQDLTTTDNATPGERSVPDAAYQTAVTLQVDQPLLRGAGSDVALAEIRIDRNAERNAIATLRRDLIKALTDTEKTYHQLVLSYRELQIQQRLLKRGEDTRDQIVGRQFLDATPSQISSTKGRVERRKADMIRAQTQVRQLSDRLKALMNDPDNPVGAEVLVLPADDSIDEPFTFSLLDSVQTALSSRPEIEQAILSIDDTSIRRVVADNARLPKLDLRLQTKFQALNGDVWNAYGDTFNGHFIDYLVGLVFEQPIGNRKAEADYRRRTVERMQAVISYRNTVQQIMVEVLTALRNVTADYRLVEQTRASRIATTDELRALVVESEKLRGLTVERLNLQLNTQELLAQAERDEAQAIADYNAAVADLYAAMGRTLERNRIDFRVPSPADAAAARYPVNYPPPQPSPEPDTHAAPQHDHE